MYDAWTAVGVGGGSAALSYIAAGRKNKAGENTMRLSLDQSGSLLGDVRLLGGAATWFASMYAKEESTKRTLNTITAASLFSLLQTEVIRWRTSSPEAQYKPAAKLPLIPDTLSSMSYGATAQPAGNQTAWSRGQAR